MPYHSYSSSGSGSGSSANSDTYKSTKDRYVLLGSPCAREGDVSLKYHTNANVAIRVAPPSTTSATFRRHDCTTAARSKLLKSIVEGGSALRYSSPGHRIYDRTRSVSCTDSRARMLECALASGDVETYKHPIPVWVDHLTPEAREAFDIHAKISTEDDTNAVDHDQNSTTRRYALTYGESSSSRLATAIKEITRKHIPCSSIGLHSSSLKNFSTNAKMIYECSLAGTEKTVTTDTGACTFLVGPGGSAAVGKTFPTKSSTETGSYVAYDTLNGIDIDAERQHVYKVCGDSKRKDTYTLSPVMSAVVEFMANQGATRSGGVAKYKTSGVFISDDPAASVQCTSAGCEFIFSEISIHQKTFRRMKKEQLILYIRPACGWKKMEEICSAGCASQLHEEFYFNFELGLHLSFPDLMSGFSYLLNTHVANSVSSAMAGDEMAPAPRKKGRRGRGGGGGKY